MASHTGVRPKARRYARMLVCNGYPPAEESIDRLRRSGWCAGEAGFTGTSGRIVWQVDGRCGEKVLRVEGATQREAWHRAVGAAAACGMLVDWPRPLRTCPRVGGRHGWRWRSTPLYVIAPSTGSSIRSISLALIVRTREKHRISLAGNASRRLGTRPTMLDHRVTTSSTSVIVAGESSPWLLTSTESWC
jgi:hypothetical protein